MVTLGKIDFGIDKLSKTQFNLSELIASSLDDFKLLLSSRKLETSIEPDIKFYGDWSRIQEMFFNLLDNAVKFTDERNGKIEVTLSCSPLHKATAKQGENEIVPFLSFPRRACRQAGKWESSIRKDFGSPIVVGDDKGSRLSNVRSMDRRRAWRDCRRNLINSLAYLDRQVCNQQPKQIRCMI